MGRAPAVNQGVVLPQPREQYDVTNERETRRTLEEALRRLLDWGVVTSVPGNVTAVAGLPGAADHLPYFTGSEAMSTTTLTAFGRLLIAATDAEGGRTTLGMGVLAQRATVVITTGSLATAVSEFSTASLPAKSNALLLIAADRAARVRLYATVAARDADAGRAATTRPTAGTGLLAEFVFDAATTIAVSPVATLANDETTPVPSVAYTITNTSGSTSTVAVTLTVLPLEI